MDPFLKFEGKVLRVREAVGTGAAAGMCFPYSWSTRKTQDTPGRNLHHVLGFTSPGKGSPEPKRSWEQLHGLENAHSWGIPAWLREFFVFREQMTLAEGKGGMVLN